MENELQITDYPPPPIELMAPQRIEALIVSESKRFGREERLVMAGWCETDCKNVEIEDFVKAMGPYWVSSWKIRIIRVNKINQSYNNETHGI